MVELPSAPYDDAIPLVMASVVDIDAELSDEYIITAEVIPLSSDSFSSCVSTSSSSTHSTRCRCGSVEPILFTPGRDDDCSCCTSHEPHRVQGTEPGPVQQLPQQDDKEGQRNVAAGTAGAVIGLFLGGPLTSLVLGLGTVYYTKQEGAAGDVARALGDVALVARDKFREVDTEHHILEQSRAAAAEALHRIQEADQRHHARDTVIRLTTSCWRSTLEFIEQHHLVERACSVLALVVAHLAAKMEEHHRRVRDASLHPRNARNGGRDRRRRSSRR